MDIFGFENPAASLAAKEEARAPPPPPPSLRSGVPVHRRSPVGAAARARARAW
jgi:hypothetical protein